MEEFLERFFGVQGDGFWFNLALQERKTEGLMKLAADLEETISHGAVKQLRTRVDSGKAACYTRPMD